MSDVETSDFQFPPRSLDVLLLSKCDAPGGPIPELGVGEGEGRVGLGTGIETSPEWETLRTTRGPSLTVRKPGYVAV